jgi:serine/threonine-protein kinase
VGEAAPLGTLPRIGERVDRYEVVAEVAHGGMAAVYAVRRSSIGGFDKILAMKVLLPHLQNERQYVDMFLDEARIASRIEHPNVVHVFDVGEHQGAPFMVMEFLRGQSLSRIRKKAHASDTPLSLGFLCRVLAQTAEGLHAAHEVRDADGELLHVVHRDVSPQNVHVGYDGQVKIVDFGIAAARGRISATRSGELKGKLAYVAPEQIDRSSRIDYRTDLWALGVTAWELFAGRRLFKADDDGTRLWKILNMEVPDLRKTAPQTPADVAAAIMCCLERTPDDRPASALFVAETFTAAARKHGFTRNADVAASINALFASERAISEERLSAAMRDAPVPIVESERTSESGSLPSSTSDMKIAIVGGTRRPRWLPVVAALALAAAIGTVGALAVSDPAEDEALEQMTTETPPPPEPDPAPAAETITVHVDPDARLVLVDGERRSDNPLAIEVSDDEPVTVELVAPDGEIVRHEVGVADDGRTLSLPELEPVAEPAEAAPAPAPMRRTRRTTKTDRDRSMMGRRGILANPY